MKASFVIPLLLLCADILAIAQSPGTFTATTGMTTGRAGHTATLLANGKVLIAGGFGFFRGRYGALFSAELYDPATLTFGTTGDMAAPRDRHTATLLPDGKVLITGGSSWSAELYDPSTGAFTDAREMSTVRSFHTATLLNNGKVLIAGGALSTTAELYDPVTGAFTATGDMTTLRAAHTATLLPDGKVSIGGGIAGRNVNIVTNELYDPETGTFAPTGETPQLGPGGDIVATATLLANGRVLTTLQYSESPDDNAAEYDPSTGAFAVTGKMTRARKHTATLLPDGTVLVAGLDWTHGFGFSANGLPSVNADIYDPCTGAFSATGAMATGRFDHTATLLPDGAVLVAGGRTPSRAEAFASAELYHPAAPATSPQLLSISGDGRGQGAILHAGTLRLASSTDPSGVGEHLEIYITGLTAGSVIPPQVIIGGRMAKVLHFGNIPGVPCLTHVNVEVPGGIMPGPTVPVRIIYLGRPTNEVTIGVH